MLDLILLRDDSMIEAVRINLRSEKDAELVIGRILAQINRDDKAKSVEIMEELFKYNPRTTVVRIFVD